jgi:hypothetical protein
MRFFGKEESADWVKHTRERIGRTPPDDWVRPANPTSAPVTSPWDAIESCETRDSQHREFDEE